jgi:hypothetical protein
MIDTQQQYIKLNIHSEESIIVVQAHSGIFECRRQEISTLNWYYRITLYSPQSVFIGS